MVTREALQDSANFEMKWFIENNFKRSICKSCGHGFWSVEPRDTCGEPPCVNYEFIGDPAIPGNWTMDTMRSAFTKFFEKNGHTPIARYPVVSRWKPDTLFTGASIYCFQPWVLNQVIEPPANPLVMSQPSFRASDLDNIGFGTARHMSIFEMMAHHAFNYPDKPVYWKDETVDFCWRWLTEALKVKPETITFKENAWEGGGFAGSCFEVLTKGNEVGTLVFMQYTGPVNGEYRPLGLKVVDTGYGLERHVWASTGSPTIYDAAYQPIIQWLEKKVGNIEADPEVFAQFCQLAGVLNVEEVNVDVARKKIASAVAEKLGLHSGEILRQLMPYHSVYQIADHTRAIAFILSDGVVPSNVAEGYLARLLIRRSLRNMWDLGLKAIPLSAVVERQIKELLGAFPEFSESKAEIMKMVDVEEEKYKTTLNRGSDIVRRVATDLLKAGKNEIDRGTLIKLYESNGLLPRDVKHFADKMLPVADVTDIDTKMAVPRTIAKTAEPKFKEKDLEGLPPTHLLFRDKEKLYAFEAKVLRVFNGNYVVLESTAFYPRGGGQEPDHGSINGHTVYDVETFGNIAIHSVEDPDFTIGETVKCVINNGRREQIARHHTATHIINGAARRVLGQHVWQAGSKKDADCAHLDITHYAALTEKEVEQIEKLANEVVRKKLPVNKKILLRDAAEKQYGWRIYQGGAVPGRYLRIIDTGGWDVEACGGIHTNNTSEVGAIVILKTERIQDGIVRLIYATGPAAEELLTKRDKALSESAKLLGVRESAVPKGVTKLLHSWKETKKELEKVQKETAQQRIESMELTSARGLRMLVAEIPDAKPDQLKEISRRLSSGDTFIFLIGTADRSYIFATAGKMAVATGLNSGELVRNAAAKLGGSGGGRPELAQGIGKDRKNVKSVLDEVRKTVGL